MSWLIDYAKCTWNCKKSIKTIAIIQCLCRVNNAYIYIFFTNALAPKSIMSSLH